MRYRKIVAHLSRSRIAKNLIRNNNNANFRQRLSLDQTPPNRRPRRRLRAISRPCRFLLPQTVRCAVNLRYGRLRLQSRSLLMLCFRTDSEVKAPFASRFISHAPSADIEIYGFRETRYLAKNNSHVLDLNLHMWVDVLWISR